jgi:hypothetical protein
MQRWGVGSPHPLRTLSALVGWTGAARSVFLTLVRIRSSFGSDVEIWFTYQKG